MGAARQRTAVAPGRPRVAVDGWELLPPDRRRGIGRFLENLLPPLAERVELVLLHRADEPQLLPGPISAPVRRWAPRDRVRVSEVEHLLRLPLDLALLQHEVAWTPGTMPPLVSRRPWVHTLHDLAPLVLDHDGYRWERRRLRATMHRLRQAATVVTPSRSSADEALRELGLDPRRVEVVPHGVPAGFEPSGPGDPHVAAQPAIAAVGHRDPRKGLREAFAVASELPRRGLPHRLHVAGDVADAVPVPSGAPVVLHGHVPDLAAFLRAAQVVIVTSHHEGFGFVPLEAMACGTPVVAFDTPAVREVVGDGGILVPEGDVAAMADAVAVLTRDPTALDDACAAAQRRAATFSWQAAADAYAALLGEAVDGPGHRRTNCRLA